MIKLKHFLCEIPLNNQQQETEKSINNQLLNTFDLQHTLKHKFLTSLNGSHVVWGSLESISVSFFRSMCFVFHQQCLTFTSSALQDLLASSIVEKYSTN